MNKLSDDTDVLNTEKTVEVRVISLKRFLINVLDFFKINLDKQI